ncbi:MAG: ribosome small subunit-dependent GTPase A [Oscillospiraceae bacterium]|nr:ribosome small subunit-dependent GTPase A [Oscillospiraceae bacterium]
MELEGIILKGIGGFYYVECDGILYECKAKGRLRNDRTVPLAGDRVTITVREGEENTVDFIHERKNSLRRPPVANIDKLLIVVSSAKPKPNTLIIDKMTVLAEKNNIRPLIVFTKTDLHYDAELVASYRKTGYSVYTFSTEDHSELNRIKEELRGCITAFTGNSGVGKSTLINSLSGELQLETGEISDKLGRGRHTTRQAEIFHVGGGLVIDTAGFSSIDFIGDNLLYSEDLQFYFAEFRDNIGKCRFTGCAHLGDMGCEICRLVSTGGISKSRYDSYVSMYNETKDHKKWKV